jgi:hypothetical protein
MNRSTTCLNECEIRRILAIVGSAIFLVLAPYGLRPSICKGVAGMVPWWISHWRVEAALLGLPTLRFLGGVLLALGAVGLLDSFGRFAIQRAWYTSWMALGTRYPYGKRSDSGAPMNERQVRTVRSKRCSNAESTTPGSSAGCGPLGRRAPTRPSRNPQGTQKKLDLY